MKHLKKICIIAIIALLLELIVFQVNSFCLIGKDAETEILNIENANLIGIEKYNDGYYIVSNEASIEFKGLNKEIKTIYFNIDSSRALLDTRIFYTDNTQKYYNEEYDLVRTKTVVEDVERTKYFVCHFSGKVGDLKFTIYNAKDTQIDSATIKINETVPYEINLVRLAVIFGVMLVIYLLFAIKEFSMPYDKKSSKHVFILQVTTFLFIILLSVYMINGQEKENLEFSRNIIDPYTGLMVDALEKGQVYLDYEPSEELKNLENPYDYTQRTKEGVSYLYDFAYYDGNYYVYFSILPIITLFLPFKIITGYYFPIGIACLIYAIIGAIYASLFTKEVLTKCFPKISVRKLVLGILFILFSSFLLFNVAFSRIYEMVAILGFALVMAGGFYFVTAFKKEKSNYLKLALSCTLLALAVSARPNLIFISLLIIPTLIEKIHQHIKQKEYKNLAKTLAAVAIPYTIIGMFIMFYNYIRFENPLEFGAQYQLTSNDMGKLGYRISTIPIGLWHYLWNPFQIDATFPFIYPIDSTPLYVGFYGSGCKGVGIFALNKIMYLLFLFPIFKDKMKRENKLTTKIILHLIITGLLMVAIITIMAASYGRYSLDFAWMFSLATLLFAIWIGDKIKENEFASKLYKTIVFILLASSFILNSLLSVSSEKPSFKIYNPVKYYELHSSICFWE